MKKEPGNSLKRARRITFKSSGKPFELFKLKDGLHSGDRDDFYLLKLKQAADLDVLLSGLKGKAKVQIYSLSKKKGKVLKKIGRTDFQDLSKKEIKRYLKRELQSSKQGKKKEHLAGELDQGLYYVRVFSKKAKDETSYKLTVKATPLSQATVVASAGVEAEGIEAPLTEGGNPLAPDAGQPEGTPLVAPTATPSVTPTPRSTPSITPAPSATPSSSTSAGVLAFSSGEFRVQEDGGAIAAVVVTRTGGSSGTVSATINLTDGTARSPQDYQNAPIAVSFADGETSKIVYVPVIDDERSEIDESINLSLTHPTASVSLGEQTSAVLTITDNDPLAGAVSVSGVGEWLDEILVWSDVYAWDAYSFIPAWSAFQYGTDEDLSTFLELYEDEVDDPEYLHAFLGQASFDNPGLMLYRIRFDNEFSATQQVKYLPFYIGESDPDFGPYNDIFTLEISAQNSSVGFEQETYVLQRDWFNSATADFRLELDSVKWYLANETNHADEIPKLVVGGDFASATVVIVDNLEGTENDNFIQASFYDEHIYGGTGNDEIRGYVTDYHPYDALDKLHGGPGNDILFSGVRPAQLYGGLGEDTLSYGFTEDYIFSGLGSDFEYGVFQEFYGGSGRDSLLGSKNNELLDGGIGADYMEGGDGNDVYVIDNLSDVIVEQSDGGIADKAILLIDGYQIPEYVEYAEIDGIDYVFVNGEYDFANTRDATYDQILEGDDGPNDLEGGSGDDTLRGKNGDDDLSGGLGDDLLEGGSGNDSLWGDEGIDILKGGEGDDRLFGREKDDLLEGGLGNDRLVGGRGADYMEGGKGNDFYDVDNLNDVVVEQSNGGDADIISISVENYQIPENIEFIGYALTIENGDFDGGNWTDSLYGTENIDRFRGHEGDDVLRGFGSDDVLEGGDGNDSLMGHEGNDILQGGRGDDFLQGMEGNDNLLGNDGDDFLEGGRGNDVINGGAGKDDLRGNGGWDILTGGSGADEFWMWVPHDPSDGVPSIVDFSHIEGDKITLGDARVGGTRTYDRVSFNSNTGELFVDDIKVANILLNTGSSDNFFVPSRDIDIWGA